MALDPKWRLLAYLGAGLVVLAANTAMESALWPLMFLAVAVDLAVLAFALTRLRGAAEKALGLAVSAWLCLMLIFGHILGMPFWLGAAAYLAALATTLGFVIYEAARRRFALPLILLLNLLAPLIVHFGLCLPLSHLGSSAHYLLDLLITPLCLPILLVILNYFHARKAGVGYARYMFCLLLATALGAWLDYYAFGPGSLGGSFWRPIDAEGVALFYVLMVLGMAVAMGGSVIAEGRLRCGEQPPAAAGTMPAGGKVGTPGKA